MDAEAVARVLARAPVFAALGDAERTKLVGQFGRAASFGWVVFHRDGPAGHLYVILSGTAKVSVADEEGHEIVVASQRDGARFGELALFDDAPRSAA